MTNCPNCNTQIEEDLKFCTDCGTKIEQNNNQQIVEKMNCPKCSAKIPPNNKFCVECGTKIEQIPVHNHDQKVVCPNCSIELPANTRFCIDCGAKIEHSVSLDHNQEIICPGCSKTLPANTRFCTSCGREINQSTEGYSDKIKSNVLKEENVDSINKIGNETIKGIGGLFNKATSKGGMLNKFSAEVDTAITGKNKDYSKGYLYCRDCGGYYKLEKGESPDDFGSCQCGGELKYVITIPKGNNSKIIFD